ncbi:MAG: ATP-binding protein [Ruminococcus sp.]|nr:ATP-binding protein [Ruminococcus sp.]
MKELKTEAIKENLPEVTAFIDEQLEAVDCPMKLQMKIDIAVEEIFVNIANYAYPDGTGTAVIRVEFTDDPLTVEITFIDSGVPYDPLAKPDPDISLSANERQIGGLGIFMVKKSMDDMKYQYLDGQNILTLIKRLVIA